MMKISFRKLVAQASGRDLLVATLMMVISSCIFLAALQAEALDDKGSSSVKLKESLKQVEECIIDASGSFLYERSYPPTSAEQLTAQCKRQADGFKCIRDKTKTGMPGIIRRGLLSFVQNRQRNHKKYCTNVNSELSKSFVKDMSCIMNNRNVFDRFQELDSILSNKAIEIERRNYNDSAIELKQICCTFYTYKRDALGAIGKECANSREKIEEFVGQITPDDISILCDDEEKLITKVCPNIEKLQVSNKFDSKKSPNAAGLMLYLIATLGEPAARRK